MELPTPEECEKCFALGKCGRHPQVPKVGRLLAICAGVDEDTSDQDRQAYMRLWDVLSGTPGATFTDPPKKPDPPPVSIDECESGPLVANERPLECRHRGAYIRLCGG